MNMMENEKLNNKKRREANGLTIYDSIWIFFFSKVVTYFHISFAP